MNEVKEIAELEREKQQDVIREKVEKQTFQQMDRLRETVRKQEEEIDRLRTERQEHLARERENQAFVDKQERSIITEINDECRKIAEVLGVTPRRANIPG